MELANLSPELKELRDVIISSSLTSCYLVLEELADKEEAVLYYQKFRSHWLEVYKGVYETVVKMKARKPSRKKNRDRLPRERLIPTSKERGK
jgi:hypothetical protein